MDIIFARDFLTKVFSMNGVEDVPHLSETTTLYDLKLTGYVGLASSYTALYAEWEEWVLRRIETVYGVVITDTKRSLNEIFEEIKATNRR